ncbi:MAG: hypothetical protein EP317_03750 [Bacillota bacterium]|nr:MAG: hypothetical protein EP317_03750 [Bacillota bacterium]
MNIVFFAISIIILGIGIILSKMPYRQRHHTTLALAWIIFSYKMIEYTIHALHFRLEKIPLEFSTITYFIFSITIIFNIKSLKTIATFMSFITGIGYLTSFIFLGQSFYAQNGVYITTAALINHSIVYLGSMMMIKNIIWNPKEEKKILIFSIIYIIYVSVLDMFVTFSQQFIFIRMLLGADVLYRLVPQNNYTSYMYLLYYISIYLAFRLMIGFFHYLCEFIKKKEVQHEHTI